MKKIRTINDITMADWEDIKRRREQGANLDQVGELYGITGTTLAKYARLAGVDIPRRTDYNPLPSIDDDTAAGGGIKIPTPRRPVPWPPQRKIFFSIFAKNKAR